jgi:hypothetical protein
MPDEDALERLVGNGAKQLLVTQKCEQLTVVWETKLTSKFDVEHRV